MNVLSTRATVATLLLLVLLCTSPLLAQKGPEAPETHCDPIYGLDIGPNFLAQPDGTFQTVDGDCTATPGCDDYFDIILSAGDTITGTFCMDGGIADFDTGLSTWDGPGFPNMLACNDDVCGLQSELVFVAPTSDTFRFRIGGFGGGAGTYTLAFQAPEGAIIVNGPIIAPPTPTIDIPTLNAYGLAGLAALLFGFGVVMMRRRATTSH